MANLLRGFITGVAQKGEEMLTQKNAAEDAQLARQAELADSLTQYEKKANIDLKKQNALKDRELLVKRENSKVKNELINAYSTGQASLEDTILKYGEVGGDSTEIMTALEKMDKIKKAADPLSDYKTKKRSREAMIKDGYSPAVADALSFGYTGSVPELEQATRNSQQKEFLAFSNVVNRTEALLGKLDVNTMSLGASLKSEASSYANAFDTAVSFVSGGTVNPETSKVVEKMPFASDADIAETRAELMLVLGALRPVVTNETGKFSDKDAEAAFKAAGVVFDPKKGVIALRQNPTAIKSAVAYLHKVAQERLVQTGAGIIDGNIIMSLPKSQQDLFYNDSNTPYAIKKSILDTRKEDSTPSAWTAEQRGVYESVVKKLTAKQITVKEGAALLRSQNIDVKNKDMK